MSVEHNKANEKRLYDEVYNKGNLSLIPELVSPDFVSGNNKGHEGYRQMVIAWRAAMPDIRFTIDEMVGEGDKLVYRLSGTGTGVSSLGGVDITGKKMSWTQAIFTEYKDGKVAKGVNFMDTLSLFRQAGVVPPAFAQAQEANKALVRRYFDEVLNKGNAALLDELMAEYYVMVRANGEIDNQGREGNKKMFAQTRASVPDLHVNIDEMLADGDKVVVSGNWEGTHTGLIGGIPPTGKRFKYGYTATYRVVEGKIVSGKIVADQMSMYQQLGVSPPALTQNQEANKALVRRFFEMANHVKGDVSRLQALVKELIAPEYVVHTPSGDWTLEQTLQMWNMVFTAFPDMNEKIEDILAEGDRVVTRSTATGTHKGAFQGMPPSGKTFRMSEVVVFRVAGGKLVEEWPLLDQLGMLQQLGAIPSVPSK